MRLRSVLFTPGIRGDRIQKALEAAKADCIVADLEDAVAPSDKPAARTEVHDALVAVPSSDAVRAVRINPWPGSLAEADLEAVLPAAPDVIVVPKAEDPAAIEALYHRIDSSRIQLLLILETAKGVLRAQELAACPGVVAIAFGAEDLAADAGMRRSQQNTEVAVPRSLVALAAAAAGVQAIDMITADFQDDGRVTTEATEAAALGYAGKMCIHPRQVEAVHSAFAPTAEEVAWAQRVLDAVDGLEEGGVAVVDGKMIDVPLIRQARRILG
ncbi:MAG: HpcH/HpaI aldolase/citrate lyase family protein [Thermoplasmatota archaeon]